MLILIILLSIIDIIFGIVMICLSPITWYYGVAVIVSGVIMIWLAYGADHGYELNKKNEKLQILTDEYKKEQDNINRVLAERCGLTLDKIKVLASIDEIKRRKDVPIDELGPGAKLVINKHIGSDTIDIKAGTICTLFEKNGDNWKVVLTERPNREYIICKKEWLTSYDAYMYEKYQEQLASE